MSVRLPSTLRPPSKQRRDRISCSPAAVGRGRRMLVTQERERELGETGDEVSPETNHRPLFPPPRVSSPSSPFVVLVGERSTDSQANNRPEKNKANLQQRNVDRGFWCRNFPTLL